MVGICCTADLFMSFSIVYLCAYCVCTYFALCDFHPLHCMNDAIRSNDSWNYYLSFLWVINVFSNKNHHRFFSVVITICSVLFHVCQNELATLRND